MLFLDYNPLLTENVNWHDNQLWKIFQRLSWKNEKYYWQIRLEWNFNITNLYITMSLVWWTIFFISVIYEKEPWYSEQILPVPWPFIALRFHCINACTGGVIILLDAWCSYMYNPLMTLFWHILYIFSCSKTQRYGHAQNLSIARRVLLLQVEVYLTKVIKTQTELVKSPTLKQILGRRCGVDLENCLCLWKICSYAPA